MFEHILKNEYIDSFPCQFFFPHVENYNKKSVAIIIINFIISHLKTGECSPSFFYSSLWLEYFSCLPKNSFLGVPFVVKVTISAENWDEMQLFNQNDNGSGAKSLTSFRAPEFILIKSDFGAWLFYSHSSSPKVIEIIFH